MASIAVQDDRACDVAIIGCGPTGAMLANLLGLQDLDVVVLDRETDIFPLPRAVHFDDEVMRLLQTVGLAGAMAGLVHVSPGMRFVDDTGRLLLDWSRPREIGPQGWHPSYRFHQPELERVLRAGLARFPRVVSRLGADVFAMAQGPDGATIQYEDLGDGLLHRLRATYVVGCDGARSLARRLIGSAMDDLGFRERWLVVDVILRRPRPDLTDYSVQYCSKRRPATYVRGTGERRRWEIQLQPHETGPAVTSPASVYDLLAPWVGPDDAALERCAVYTFRSALAERWRAGRVLIAGDAAHLTPPFLGQGMCAGMRDAGNLAWKLGRVLRGQSGEALLDSYQTERAQHVRAYIELAVRIGGLINTSGMEQAVPTSVLAGGEAARMHSIKPLLGPGPGGGWTGPRGRVAPQPRLSCGTLLDDRAGYRHALLMRPEFERHLPGALIERIGARGAVMLADAAGPCRDFLDDVRAEAVLIRPDRYIHGAARDVAEMQDLAASF
jgi:3-(3-hydroxy-phenyl)propionate hydroxylase